MFWQVNYIINNGYDWYRHVAVVKAENADEAVAIMEEYVKKTYTRNDDTLLKEYTVATKLPNDDGVIFNK